jgi:hypothetical protein
MPSWAVGLGAILWRTIMDRPLGVTSHTRREYEAYGVSDEDHGSVPW